MSGGSDSHMEHTTTTCAIVANFDRLGRVGNIHDSEMCKCVWAEIVGYNANIRITTSDLYSDGLRKIGYRDKRIAVHLNRRGRVSDVHDPQAAQVSRQICIASDNSYLQHFTSALAIVAWDAVASDLDRRRRISHIDDPHATLPSRDIGVAAHDRHIARLAWQCQRADLDRGGGIRHADDPQPGASGDVRYGAGGRDLVHDPRQQHRANSSGMGQVGDVQNRQLGAQPNIDIVSLHGNSSGVPAEIACSQEPLSLEARGRLAWP